MDLDDGFGLCGWLVHRILLCRISNDVQGCPPMPVDYRGGHPAPNEISPGFPTNNLYHKKEIRKKARGGADDIPDWK